MAKLRTTASGNARRQFSNVPKARDEIAEEQKGFKHVYPDLRPRLMLDPETRDILFKAMDKAREEIGDTFGADPVSDAKRVESILLSARDCLLKSTKSERKKAVIAATYGNLIRNVGVTPD